MTYLLKNTLKYGTYLCMGVATTVIITNNLFKTAKSVDQIQQSKELKQCFKKCKIYDYADTLMAYNTCINACEIKLKNK